MNFLEAVRSGKKFRHTAWADGIWVHSGEWVGNQLSGTSNEELLSEGWEAAEPAITITRIAVQKLIDEAHLESVRTNILWSKLLLNRMFPGKS